MNILRLELGNKIPAVGTNRTYWQLIKENLLDSWEKIKLNPFVNMVIPLEELSEGKTEAVLPMIIPGALPIKKVVQTAKPVLRSASASKIREAERLGIPKGERSSYLSGSNADPSFYSGIGLNNLRYLLRLRDYHASQKGNTGEVYSHMSPNEFTIFDKNFFGTTSDDGFNGIGFYFGKTYVNGKYKPNLLIAQKTKHNPERFAGPHGEIWHHSYPGSPKYFYLYGTPTYEVKSSLNYFKDPEFLIHKTDASDLAEIIVGHPELIKLSNAITYDDLGNIIPLSKRDNLLSPDIRYKIGGKLNYLNYFK